MILPLGAGPIGPVAPGFKSGYVGIVGRPNVGKSTLLNRLLGEKIAIVTPKPQTTRGRILGVLNLPNAQVLFLDSPGLHQPQHALGRYMLEVVKAVMSEADVLVAMIDARAGITADDERVFTRIRQTGRPALLVLNKADTVRKPKLLPLLERCARLNLFRELIPVSALLGDQVDVLLASILTLLPEGPRWYEEDQRTDQTLEQRISELIREQIMLATFEEVPGAVAVQIDTLESRERVTAIQATAMVERQGQKAILIGKGGSMMKKIGTEARAELEHLLGRKVHLEIWVKVVEDWRSDERRLRELGFLSE